ncbi:MAG: immune inhibitor A [Anaerolineales bacterium]|nr:immune inhibitor A [Anaerolineales bacterium]
MKNPWILPGIILVVIILCVCGLCLVGAIGASYFWLAEPRPSAAWEASSPTSTPAVLRPTLNPGQENETPSGAPTPGEPAVERTPVSIPAGPEDNLRILMEAEIPDNDLPDLVRRLEGIQDIPMTVPPPTSPLQVGDKETFWASNTDTNANFEVSATLRYITDHAYFWIEDGVTYNARDLRDLAEAFEERIYPTNREFFGSEWTPGVDGDPHIYILYVRGMGESIAGYFSTMDEYTPLVNEYTNSHEMFLFSADNVTFDEEFTYGVLAHEFQHMIHWYRDRNEESWVNEGFSELATFLNDYSAGGFDGLYVMDPDVQLNVWPVQHELSGPHYGASFLFMTYFLDRFGEDATKALVSHSENGLESIDLSMAEMDESDPLTGETITADDIFVDWTVATFLQDERVGDGRYIYHNYPDAPQPSETEDIEECTPGERTRDVNQYGVDYIRIRCDSSTTLRFEGSTVTSVLPADPHSGSYAFWSNKGDESDMTLTRAFDFSEVTGPLTLNYWTWYDIEKDFDYLYLLASTDGERWEILHTPSGTPDDPTGANFGWGYNAKSGTNDYENGEAIWLEESVDLSHFAGKQVQLRFEYVTDAVANGEGFLLDDLAIPEIDYATDFESNDGGWQAAGFVRIQNLLPQTYRLTLITKGREIQVQHLTLNPGNTVEVPLDFDGDLKEAILIVSGTTRFTIQPTAYRYYFTD